VDDMDESAGVVIGDAEDVLAFLYYLENNNGT
jgi:hypothetical protein